MTRGLWPRLSKAIEVLGTLTWVCSAPSGCSLSGWGETPVPDQQESPTPFVGMDLRTTTWRAMFSTGLDPLVEGHTMLYMNTETLVDGEVTGWFWHAYGELSVDGYDVPEGEAVELFGTYDGVNLYLEGRLHGHVLETQGTVVESEYSYYSVLTLDDDLYEFPAAFGTTEYWPVIPY